VTIDILPLFPSWSSLGYSSLPMEGGEGMTDSVSVFMTGEFTSVVIVTNLVVATTALSLSYPFSRWLTGGP
jgi:hypothetical protein